MISSVANWLYHALVFSWHNAGGYNFVSGPLADITLLGGGYAIYRRHKCHVGRCPRIARARVPGTHYIVCGKHHPSRHPPTAEEVLHAHKAAMERLHQLPIQLPTEEPGEDSDDS